jgi:hypothetical protein
MPVFPVAVLVALALDGLPRQPVEMTIHERALHCEGVALVDLLRHGDAMSADPLRGADLSKVVVLSARDGYRVVFALSELDDTLGATRAFVVDRCDGKPLDPDTGPLRLLVPDDKRAARSLRQLDAIRVETLP